MWISLEESRFVIFTTFGKPSKRGDDLYCEAGAVKKLWTERALSIWQPYSHVVVPVDCTSLTV